MHISSRRGAKVVRASWPNFIFKKRDRAPSMFLLSDVTNCFKKINVLQ